MCEINSHGGIVVEKRNFRIMYKKMGLYWPEPGEFTKKELS